MKGQRMQLVTRATLGSATGSGPAGLGEHCPALSQGTLQISRSDRMGSRVQSRGREALATFQSRPRLQKPRPH